MFGFSMGYSESTDPPHYTILATSLYLQYTIFSYKAYILQYLNFEEHSHDINEIITG